MFLFSTKKRHERSASNSSLQRRQRMTAGFRATVDFPLLWYATSDQLQRASYFLTQLRAALLAAQTSASTSWTAQNEALLQLFDCMQRDKELLALTTSVMVYIQSCPPPPSSSLSSHLISSEPTLGTSANTEKATGGTSLNGTLIPIRQSFFRSTTTKGSTSSLNGLDTTSNEDVSARASRTLTTPETDDDLLQAPLPMTLGDIVDPSGAPHSITHTFSFFPSRQGKDGGIAGSSSLDSRGMPGTSLPSLANYPTSSPGGQLSLPPPPPHATSFSPPSSFAGSTVSAGRWPPEGGPARKKEEDDEHLRASGTSKIPPPLSSLSPPASPSHGAPSPLPSTPPPSSTSTGGGSLPEWQAKLPLHPFSFPYVEFLSTMWGAFDPRHPIGVQRRALESLEVYAAALVGEEAWRQAREYMLQQGEWGAEEEEAQVAGLERHFIHEVFPNLLLGVLSLLPVCSMQIKIPLLDFTEMVLLFLCSAAVRQCTEGILLVVLPLLEEAEGSELHRRGLRLLTRVRRKLGSGVEGQEEGVAILYAIVWRLLVEVPSRRMGLWSAVLFLAQYDERLLRVQEEEHQAAIAAAAARRAKQRGERGRASPSPLRVGAAEVEETTARVRRHTTSSSPVGSLQPTRGGTTPTGLPHPRPSHLRAPSERDGGGGVGLTSPLATSFPPPPPPSSHSQYPSMVFSSSSLSPHKMGGTTMPSASSSGGPQPLRVLYHLPLCGGDPRLVYYAVLYTFFSSYSNGAKANKRRAMMMMMSSGGGGTRRQGIRFGEHGYSSSGTIGRGGGSSASSTGGGGGATTTGPARGNTSAYEGRVMKLALEFLLTYAPLYSFLLPPALGTASFVSTTASHLLLSSTSPFSSSTSMTSSSSTSLCSSSSLSSTSSSSSVADTPSFFSIEDVAVLVAAALQLTSSPATLPNIARRLYEWVNTATLLLPGGALHRLPEVTQLWCCQYTTPVHQIDEGGGEVVEEERGKRFGPSTTATSAKRSLSLSDHPSSLEPFGRTTRPPTTSSQEESHKSASELPENGAVALPLGRSALEQGREEEEDDPQRLEVRHHVERKRVGSGLPRSSCACCASFSHLLFPEEDPEGKGGVSRWPAWFHLIMHPQAGSLLVVHAFRLFTQWWLAKEENLLPPRFPSALTFPRYILRGIPDTRPSPSPHRTEKRRRPRGPPSLATHKREKKSRTSRPSSPSHIPEEHPSDTEEGNHTVSPESVPPVTSTPPSSWPCEEEVWWWCGGGRCCRHPQCASPISFPTVLDVWCCPTVPLTCSPIQQEVERRTTLPSSSAIPIPTTRMSCPCACHGEGNGIPPAGASFPLRTSTDFVWELLEEEANHLISVYGVHRFLSPGGGTSHSSPRGPPAALPPPFSPVSAMEKTEELHPPMPCRSSKDGNDDKEITEEGYPRHTPAALWPLVAPQLHAQEEMFCKTTWTTPVKLGSPSSVVVGLGSSEEGYDEEEEEAMDAIALLGGTVRQRRCRRRREREEGAVPPHRNGSSRAGRPEGTHRSYALPLVWSHLFLQLLTSRTTTPDARHRVRSPLTTSSPARHYYTLPAPFASFSSLASSPWLCISMKPSCITNDEVEDEEEYMRNDRHRRRGGGNSEMWSTTTSHTSTPYTSQTLMGGAGGMGTSMSHSGGGGGNSTAASAAFSAFGTHGSAMSAFLSSHVEALLGPQLCVFAAALSSTSTSTSSSTMTTSTPYLLVEEAKQATLQALQVLVQDRLGWLWLSHLQEEVATALRAECEGDSYPEKTSQPLPPPSSPEQHEEEEGEEVSQEVVPTATTAAHDKEKFLLCTREETRHARRRSSMEGAPGRIPMPNTSFPSSRLSLVDSSCCCTSSSSMALLSLFTYQPFLCSSVALWRLWEDCEWLWQRYFQEGWNGHDAVARPTNEVAGAEWCWWPRWLEQHTKQTFSSAVVHLNATMIKMASGKEAEEEEGMGVPGGVGGISTPSHHCQSWGTALTLPASWHRGVPPETTCNRVDAHDGGVEMEPEKGWRLASPPSASSHPHRSPQVPLMTSDAFGRQGVETVKPHARALRHTHIIIPTTKEEEETSTHSAEHSPHDGGPSRRRQATLPASREKDASPTRCPPKSGTEMETENKEELSFIPSLAASPYEKSAEEATLPPSSTTNDTPAMEPQAVPENRAQDTSPPEQEEEDPKTSASERTREDDEEEGTASPTKKEETMIHPSRLFSASSSPLSAFPLEEEAFLTASSAAAGDSPRREPRALVVVPMASAVPHPRRTRSPVSCTKSFPRTHPTRKLDPEREAWYHDDDDHDGVDDHEKGRREGVHEGFLRRRWEEPCVASWRAGLQRVQHFVLALHTELSLVMTTTTPSAHLFSFSERRRTIVEGLLQAIEGHLERVLHPRYNSYMEGLLSDEETREWNDPQEEEEVGRTMFHPPSRRLQRKGRSTASEGMESEDTPSPPSREGEAEPVWVLWNLFQQWDPLWRMWITLPLRLAGASLGTKTPPMPSSVLERNYFSSPCIRPKHWVPGKEEEDEWKTNTAAERENIGCNGEESEGMAPPCTLPGEKGDAAPQRRWKKCRRVWREWDWDWWSMVVTRLTRVYLFLVQYYPMASYGVTSAPSSFVFPTFRSRSASFSATPMEEGEEEEDQIPMMRTTGKPDDMDHDATPTHAVDEEEASARPAHTTSGFPIAEEGTPEVKKEIDHDEAGEKGLPHTTKWSRSIPLSFATPSLSYIVPHYFANSLSWICAWLTWLHRHSMAAASSCEGPSLVSFFPRDVLELGMTKVAYTLAHTLDRHEAVVRMEAAAIRMAVMVVPPLPILPRTKTSLFSISMPGEKETPPLSREARRRSPHDGSNEEVEPHDMDVPPKRILCSAPERRSGAPLTTPEEWRGTPYDDHHALPEEEEEERRRRWSEEAVDPRGEEDGLDSTPAEKWKSMEERCGSGCWRMGPSSFSFEDVYAGVTSDPPHVRQKTIALLTTHSLSTPQCPHVGESDIKEAIGKTTPLSTYGGMRWWWRVVAESVVPLLWEGLYEGGAGLDRSSSPLTTASSIPRGIGTPCLGGETAEKQVEPPKEEKRGWRRSWRRFMEPQEQAEHQAQREVEILRITTAEWKREEERMRLALLLDGMKSGEAFQMVVRQQCLAQAIPQEPWRMDTEEAAAAVAGVPAPKSKSSTMVSSRKTSPSRYTAMPTSSADASWSAMLSSSGMYQWKEEAWIRSQRIRSIRLCMYCLTSLNVSAHQDVGEKTRGSVPDARREESPALDPFSSSLEAVFTSTAPMGNTGVSVEDYAQCGWWAYHNAMMATATTLGLPPLRGKEDHDKTVLLPEPTCGLFPFWQALTFLSASHPTASTVSLMETCVLDVLQHSPAVFLLPLRLAVTAYVQYRQWKERNADTMRCDHHCQGKGGPPTTLLPLPTSEDDADDEAARRRRSLAIRRRYQWAAKQWQQWERPPHPTTSFSLNAPEKDPSTVSPEWPSSIQMEREEETEAAIELVAILSYIRLATMSLEYLADGSFSMGAEAAEEVSRCADDLWSMGVEWSGKGDKRSSPSLVPTAGIAPAEDPAQAILGSRGAPDTRAREASIADWTDTGYPLGLAAVTLEPSEGMASHTPAHATQEARQRGAVVQDEEKFASSKGWPLSVVPCAPPAPLPWALLWGKLFLQVVAYELCAPPEHTSSLQDGNEETSLLRAPPRTALVQWAVRGLDAVRRVLLQHPILLLSSSWCTVSHQDAMDELLLRPALQLLRCGTVEHAWGRRPRGSPVPGWMPAVCSFSREIRHRTATTSSGGGRKAEEEMERKPGRGAASATPQLWNGKTKDEAAMEALKQVVAHEEEEGMLQRTMEKVMYSTSFPLVLFRWVLFLLELQTREEEAQRVRSERRMQRQTHELKMEKWEKSIGTAGGVATRGSGGTTSSVEEDDEEEMEAAWRKRGKTPEWNTMLATLLTSGGVPASLLPHLSPSLPSSATTGGTVTPSLSLLPASVSSPEASFSSISIEEGGTSLHAPAANAAFSGLLLPMPPVVYRTRLAIRVLVRTLQEAVFQSIFTLVDPGSVSVSSRSTRLEELSAAITAMTAGMDTTPGVLPTVDPTTSPLPLPSLPQLVVEKKSHPRPPFPQEETKGEHTMTVPQQDVEWPFSTPSGKPWMEIGAGHAAIPLSKEEEEGGEEMTPVPPQQEEGQDPALCSTAHGIRWQRKRMQKWMAEKQQFYRQLEKKEIEERQTEMPERLQLWRACMRELLDARCFGVPIALDEWDVEEAKRRTMTLPHTGVHPFHSQVKGDEKPHRALRGKAISVALSTTSSPSTLLHREKAEERVSTTTTSPTGDENLSKGAERQLEPREKEEVKPQTAEESHTTPNPTQPATEEQATRVGPREGGGNGKVDGEAGTRPPSIPLPSTTTTTHGSPSTSPGVPFLGLHHHTLSTGPPSHATRTHSIEGVPSSAASCHRVAGVLLTTWRSSLQLLWMALITDNNQQNSIPPRLRYRRMRTRASRSSSSERNEEEEAEEKAMEEEAPWGRPPLSVVVPGSRSVSLKASPVTTTPPGVSPQTVVEEAHRQKRIYQKRRKQERKDLKRSRRRIKEEDLFSHMGIENEEVREAFEEVMWEGLDTHVDPTTQKMPVSSHASSFAYTAKKKGPSLSQRLFRLGKAHPNEQRGGRAAEQVRVVWECAAEACVDGLDDLLHATALYLKEEKEEQARRERVQQQQETATRQAQQALEEERKKEAQEKKKRDKKGIDPTAYTATAEEVWLLGSGGVFPASDAKSVAQRRTLHALHAWKQREVRSSFFTSMPSSPLPGSPLLEAASPTVVSPTAPYAMIGVITERLTTHWIQQQQEWCRLLKGFWKKTLGIGKEQGKGGSEKEGMKGRRWWWRSGGTTTAVASSSKAAQHQQALEVLASKSMALAVVYAFWCEGRGNTADHKKIDDGTDKKDGGGEESEKCSPPSLSSEVSEALGPLLYVLFTVSFSPSPRVFRGLFDTFSTPLVPPLARRLTHSVPPFTRLRFRHSHAMRPITTPSRVPATILARKALTSSSTDACAFQDKCTALLQWLSRWRSRNEIVSPFMLWWLGHFYIPPTAALPAPAHALGSTTTTALSSSLMPDPMWDMKKRLERMKMTGGGEEERIPTEGPHSSTISPSSPPLLLPPASSSASFSSPTGGGGTVPERGLPIPTFPSPTTSPTTMAAPTMPGRRSFLVVPHGDPPLPPSTTSTSLLSRVWPTGGGGGSVAAPSSRYRQGEDVMVKAKMLCLESFSLLEGEAPVQKTVPMRWEWTAARTREEKHQLQRTREQEEEVKEEHNVVKSDAAGKEGEARWVAMEDETSLAEDITSQKEEEALQYALERAFGLLSRRVHGKGGDGDGPSLIRNGAPIPLAGVGGGGAVPVMGSTASSSCRNDGPSSGGGRRKRGTGTTSSTSSGMGPLYELLLAGGALSSHAPVREAWAYAHTTALPLFRFHAQRELRVFFSITSYSMLDVIQWCSQAFTTPPPPVWSVSWRPVVVPPPSSSLSSRQQTGSCPLPCLSTALLRCDSWRPSEEGGMGVGSKETTCVPTPKISPRTTPAAGTATPREHRSISPAPLAVPHGSNTGSVPTTPVGAVDTPRRSRRTLTTSHPPGTPPLVSEGYGTRGAPPLSPLLGTSVPLLEASASMSSSISSVMAGGGGGERESLTRAGRHAPPASSMRSGEGGIGWGGSTLLPLPTIPLLRGASSSNAEVRRSAFWMLVAPLHGVCSFSQLLLPLLFSPPLPVVKSTCSMASRDGHGRRRSTRRPAFRPASGVRPRRGRREELSCGRPTPMTIHGGDTVMSPYVYKIKRLEEEAGRDDRAGWPSDKESESSEIGTSSSMTSPLEGGSGDSEATPFGWNPREGHGVRGPSSWSHASRSSSLSSCSSSSSSSWSSCSSGVEDNRLGRSGRGDGNITQTFLSARRSLLPPTTPPTPYTTHRRLSSAAAAGNESARGRRLVSTSASPPGKTIHRAPTIPCAPQQVASTEEEEDEDDEEEEEEEEEEHSTQEMSIQYFLHNIFNGIPSSALPDFGSAIFLSPLLTLLRQRYAQQMQWEASCLLHLSCPTSQDPASFTTSMLARLWVGEQYDDEDGMGPGAQEEGRQGREKRKQGHGLLSEEEVGVLLQLLSQLFASVDTIPGIPYVCPYAAVHPTAAGASLPSRTSPTPLPATTPTMAWTHLRSGSSGEAPTSVEGNPSSTGKLLPSPPIMRFALRTFPSTAAASQSLLRILLEILHLVLLLLPPDTPSPLPFPSCLPCPPETTTTTTAAMPTISSTTPAMAPVTSPSLLPPPPTRTPSGIAFAAEEKAGGGDPASSPAPLSESMRKPQDRTMEGTKKDSPQQEDEERGVCCHVPSTISSPPPASLSSLSSSMHRPALRDLSEAAISRAERSRARSATTVGRSEMGYEAPHFPTSRTMRPLSACPPPPPPPALHTAWLQAADGSTTAIATALAHTSTGVRDRLREVLPLLALRVLERVGRKASSALPGGSAGGGRRKLVGGGSNASGSSNSAAALLFQARQYRWEALLLQAFSLHFPAVWTALRVMVHGRTVEGWTRWMAVTPRRPRRSMVSKISEESMGHAWPAIWRGTLVSEEDESEGEEEVTHNRKRRRRGVLLAHSLPFRLFLHSSDFCVPPSAMAAPPPVGPTRTTSSTAMMMLGTSSGGGGVGTLSAHAAPMLSPPSTSPTATAMRTTTPLMGSRSALFSISTMPPSTGVPTGTSSRPPVEPPSTSTSNTGEGGPSASPVVWSSTCQRSVPAGPPALMKSQRAVEEEMVFFFSQVLLPSIRYPEASREVHHRRPIRRRRAGQASLLAVLSSASPAKGQSKKGDTRSHALTTTATAAPVTTTPSTTESASKPAARSGGGFFFSTSLFSRASATATPSPLPPTTASSPAAGGGEEVIAGPSSSSAAGGTRLSGTMRTSTSREGSKGGMASAGFMSTAAAGGGARPWRGTGSTPHTTSLSSLLLATPFTFFILSLAYDVFTWAGAMGSGREGEGGEDLRSDGGMGGGGRGEGEGGEENVLQQRLGDQLLFRSGYDRFFNVSSPPLLRLLSRLWWAISRSSSSFCAVMEGRRILSIPYLTTTTSSFSTLVVGPETQAKPNGTGEDDMEDKQGHPGISTRAGLRSSTNRKTTTGPTGSSTTSSGGGRISSLLSGTDERLVAHQKAAHLRHVAFHLLSADEERVTNRELLNYFLTLFSSHVREYSVAQLIKPTVNRDGRRVIQLPTASPSFLKQFFFAHPAQQFLQVEVPCLVEVWTAIALLFRCLIWRLSTDTFLTYFWPVFLPELQYVLQLPTGTGIGGQIVQHAVQVLQLEALKTIDIALTVCPTQFAEFRWWLMELRLSFACHASVDFHPAYDPDLMASSSSSSSSKKRPPRTREDTEGQHNRDDAMTNERKLSAIRGGATTPPHPRTSDPPLLLPAAPATPSLTPHLLHPREEEWQYRWSVVQEGLDARTHALWYLPHPATSAREALGPMTCCGLLRWTPTPKATTVHHIHPHTTPTRWDKQALLAALLPRFPPFSPLWWSPAAWWCEQEVRLLCLGEKRWKCVVSKAEKKEETRHTTEGEGVGRSGKEENAMHPSEVSPIEEVTEEDEVQQEEGEEEEEEEFFQFLFSRTVAQYRSRPYRCRWFSLALAERKHFESWQGVQFVTRLLLRQYSFPALPPPAPLPSWNRVSFSSSWPFALSTSSSGYEGGHRGIPAVGTASLVRLGAAPSAWTWDVEAVRESLLQDFYQSSGE